MDYSGHFTRHEIDPKITLHTEFYGMCIGGVGTTSLISKFLIIGVPVAFVGPKLWL